MINDAPLWAVALLAAAMWAALFYKMGQEGPYA